MLSCRIITTRDECATYQQTAHSIINMMSSGTRPAYNVPSRNQPQDSIIVVACTCQLPLVPLRALTYLAVLSGPLLACFACCLWLRLPWAAVRGLCSFAFRALVSSCSDVCPLCWLPRRLVYVRHVRILDSKKKTYLACRPAHIVIHSTLWYATSQCVPPTFVCSCAMSLHLATDLTDHSD
jgi:hypothetical protein